MLKSFACLVVLGWSIGVAAADKPAILVVGDSLSAAYGIEQSLGWVALLQQRLDRLGLDYRVVNASVTGDTTSGGLARLDAALKRVQPAIVLVALGGNDGLRGLSLRHLRDNLRAMVDDARQAGARVLLLGVKLPANYGSVFGEKFHSVYHELADEKDVALVPFFLAGVAETRDMMQDDGIHPAAVAQPRILDNVWDKLRPML